MREPIGNYDVWLFLIIGVVMVIVLIFVSAKLMDYLDNLADRKMEKKENLSKTDQN